LRLLSAGIDAPGLSAARTPSPARIITGLRKLDADYVVMDLGSGFGRETLDAYLAADVSVFVTVPEPTAIENTYQFLRAAFARALINSVENQEERVGLSRRIRAVGGAPAPLDLHEMLAREGHPLAPSALELMRKMRPQIVINQTRLRADLELGFSMQSAVRRRLGITIEYLGHIDNDDTVWACARSRRPLLVESPGTKSSKKIEKIARRLLTLESSKAQPMSGATTPEDTHHDLLEVERGATDDEIRRAYKRARETYAAQALCCYGLFEPHEIETLRGKLDEAFDVLLDPSRRRPYETSVFRAEPEPVRVRPPVDEDAEPRPAAPDLTPDTEFTGQLLKQVRESQGVELRDIGQRSKVGLGYLKAIEEDDFDHLPALVYTTGFVAEFARFLKLDPQQVCRSYIGRYRRYLQDRGRL
jgi:flagellar biosynthesis protein FlhG